MKNSIYDIAINYTDTQAEIIDPFQREAPLFQNLPCMETSQMDKNVFEIIKDVAVPAVSEFDAPLPDLYANTELNYASLSKIGGRINLPLDKCTMMGGARKLFDKQLPAIMNRTGQAFDYAFIYNCLRKFCIEHAADGCVTNLGGADGSCYSAIGVTWGLGENCGLFKPALSGAKMFNMYWLNNGYVGNIKNAAGKDISGFAVELTMFLGIQLPRTDRVHAMVNIDASHLPTYEQWLDFVLAFNGYTANSIIFMHPKLINMVRAAFFADNAHKDFITVDANGVLRFDGCVVAPDANMLKGTEAQVSL